MNNKYNKVPPTLLCPLLTCKYQWSASADLCAEYNTVASVTKDRLWAEICYPDHWNKSLSRVYHLRHGLMTRALCDCGFMLFMPSVQPGNSTPNRKQESSEQASSCFSLIYLTSPVCSNQLFHLLFLNMFCFSNLRFIELCFLQNAAAVVLRCYLITCLLVFLSESYLWLMFVFLSTL